MVKCTWQTVSVRFQLRLRNQHHKVFTLCFAFPHTVGKSLCLVMCWSKTREAWKVVSTISRHITFFHDKSKQHNKTVWSFSQTLAKHFLYILVIQFKHFLATHSSQLTYQGFCYSFVRTIQFLWFIPKCYTEGCRVKEALQLLYRDLGDSFCCWWVIGQMISKHRVFSDKP